MRGNARPVPTARSTPKSFGWLHRRRRPVRHELAVAEPQRFDGVRECERDDAERQPAESERGKPNHDSHAGGDQGREQRRERERNTPALRDARQRERRDAGERELREGDLPRKARDDHIRKPEDRGDQRGDDRAAPRALRDARGRARRARCRRSSARAATVGGARVRVAGARRRLGRESRVPVTSKRTDDDDQGDQLGGAGVREPRVLAREGQRLGLQHADHDARGHGRNEQLEVTHCRGGERGNDREGVGRRASTG